MKVIQGGLLPFSKYFLGHVEQKMSETTINTVENIDEVGQRSLLTTCTTKLHRYYRVIQKGFGFSPI